VKKVFAVVLCLLLAGLCGCASGIADPYADVLDVLAPYLNFTAR